MKNKELDLINELTNRFAKASMLEIEFLNDLERAKENDDLDYDVARDIEERRRDEVLGWEAFRSQMLGTDQ